MPKGRKYYSRPITESESKLQEAVSHYLQVSYGNLLFFHTPNGGFRYKKQAKNFKAQGVKAGIPDIMIIKARGDYHGFACELKVGKNKPTIIQLAVMEQLKQEGWRVHVAYSLAEFSRLFSEYMGDDKFKIMQPRNYDVRTP